jgi:uncharacterized protein YfaS (alpha-2-macroglobulin family)
MVVTAAVPFDGEVLVAFAEGDIMRWEKGTAKRGEAKIPFTIPSEWKGKGIYVLATVFRSGATETTRAGPNRAIGITYFDVKGEHSGYAAAIEVLGNARQGHITPDEDLSFKVCVADSTGKCSASPPKDAYAVAFVVDEGLLSLTGRDEAVVDPERYFYGRKAFALQIMDNYDRLLLRDGGDRPTRLALSNFRSTRIVSVSRGPTKLENGSATFTIPKIALAEGAVSIFSVVWSRDYAAAATEKVPVRGFVVADLHSPTFLLAGDRAVLPLRLDNIQYPHRGEFAVRVTSSGPIAGLAMFEKGKRPPPVAAQAELRTVLNQNEPGQTVYVALDTSPDGQGEAKLQVSIDPIGASEPLRGNKREWTFDVRPALLASVDTISFPLERGAVNLRTLIENEIKANYDPKSVMITARFSDSTKALLTASVGSTDPKTSSVLDRLVWQGLFLLHSGDPSRGPAQSAGITRILGEIQSLQAADGSFVPYRTPGDTVGISPDAIMQNAMALDFLWLAGNAGYSVPEKSVRAARQSLVAQLRLAFGPGTFEPNCTLAHLYSVLVLLNAGHTEHERINSFKKCKFENDDVARAAAAAVMAKYGFSNEATLILANFQDGKDPKRFGELNDFRAAMMLTFLVEAGAPSPLLEAVAEILLKPTAAQIKGSSAFAGNGSSLSGATAAWLTRAAKTSPDSTAKLALSDFMIDGGVSSPASLLQRGRTGAFEMSPVRFSELSPTLSIGTKPEIRGVRGSVTIEGVRTKPHEAERVPTGAIKRRFFNPVTGAEINPAAERFGFGDRVIVVVEGDRRVLRTTPKPAPRNQRPAGAAPSEPESDSDVNEPVLLVDLLPSAFQVLSNTTLGRPDLPGMLGKLPRRGNLQSVETSPDRWVALIVPESRKPPPNAGAVPPQQPPPSAAAPAAEPSADDKVEFRQAYSVRVNMAGRFILPPLSIEETKPPVRTMWTEPTRIEIRLPEASSQ